MATQPPSLQSDQLKELQQIPLQRLLQVLSVIVLIISNIVAFIYSWENHMYLVVGSSIFFSFLTCILFLLKRFFPSYILLYSLRSKVSTKKASFRGSLGIPPLTDSEVIIQRQEMVNHVYEHLIQPNVSAVVLKGVGGAGKSTFAALLREHVESQRHASHGPFTSEPIWLTIDPTITMVDMIGTLLQALKKPIWKLDKMTTSEQVNEFCKLISTTKYSRLVILDQFENLLDPQTGYAKSNQPAVDQLIKALQKQSYKSRVLFVTRTWPKGYSKDRGHLYEYHVEGLTTSEGMQLLKQRGTKASNEELRLAVEYCGGHPLALALLASFCHEYHLDLYGLLNKYTYRTLWMEAIARSLFDDIFKKRLSKKQYNLLFTLAIYQKPMPLILAYKALKEVSQTEAEVALNGLLSQFLLIESNAHYYQPNTIIVSYIKYTFLKLYGHDIESSSENIYDYKTTPSFQQASAIIRKQQYDNDLSTLLETIWHFCQAGQWRKAYKLMEEERHNLKNRRRAPLLELFKLLLPLDKWQAGLDESACVYYHVAWAYADLGQKKEAANYYDLALDTLRKRNGSRRLEEGRTLNDLGRTYSILGKKKESLEYLKEALTISSKEKDRKWEVKALNNLALVYNDLGRSREALALLEKALNITMEEEDCLGKGRTLNNLGQIYSDLENEKYAKQYYEQALSIRREENDLNGEGTTLRNLGFVYAELGKKAEALRYLEQALLKNKEAGDLRGQGQTLNVLGIVYMDLEQTKEASGYLIEALNILREVEDHWAIGKAFTNLVRLYLTLGQIEEAKYYLEEALKMSRMVGDRKREGRLLNYSSKIHNDIQQLEQALVILKGFGDQKGEGWTLHNLGLMYSNLKQHKKALEYFQQALRIRKEVGDLKGEGWTLHNIGLFYKDQKHYDVALAHFLSAEHIFKAIGSSHFDEPQVHIKKTREEVGTRQFNILLTKVKSQIPQIIEQVSLE